MKSATQRTSALSADLHIHSTLSPCAEDSMTPPEVIKKLLALEIDMFSITDHNSVFNNSAFQAHAESKGIVFIPGIELQSSEEIHLLGYFPNLASQQDFYLSIEGKAFTPGLKNDPARFGHQKKIDKFGNFVGEEERMLSMPLTLGINELVNAIHSFGGAAVAAHLDRGFSVVTQLGFIPPELDIDGVEIRDITKIKDFETKYLTGLELPILSSSDSHHLNMMTPAKMRIRMETNDIEGFLNCLLSKGKGRITISTRGKTKPVVKQQARTGDWKNIYTKK